MLIRKGVTIMKNIKVYFDGTLECGAHIQGAMVIVPEDYTMNQLVTAIREAGYITFRTETMNRAVSI